MKRVVASLLTLVGLLGISQVAIAEDPVYFADANLKAAVESELGIYDPTPTDMLALNTFEAYGTEIQFLTGIEYAINLTSLRLNENQISDISALSGLTNLTHLNLSVNQISDISPLSDLSNLEGLILFHNPLNGEAYCIYLPLIEDNNPDIYMEYDPDTDTDEDEIIDSCDNCPNDTNPNQEDSYPPQGNNIGDTCECEGDFDCDGDVDGTDTSFFKLYFGRNLLFYPCDEINPCNGDFDCDNDCDGTDAALFKSDFGRSSFNNPCPACVVGDWCVYE